MIYLDTNVIIYAIANDEKYGKSCKNILLDIESKKIEVCASTLVLVEVINVLNNLNKILKKENKKELDIKKNIDSLLSLPIIWFNLDLFIIKRAAEYKYNIIGVDYLHLASMEINSVTQIISADKELDKVEFIKRIDPLSY